MKSGMERRTILVGDDDAEVRDYLAMTLRCRGYNVHLAPDGEGVVSHLSAGRPASLVLLDIMMPNKDGWETLRDIRKMNLDVPVIMLSGMPSPPNIVQAIKGGAVDFLPKPVNHEDLNRAVERAFRTPEPAAEPNSNTGTGMFIGQNAMMKTMRSWLPKVAESDVPVLIHGETGTGKEVLARHLHELSARANKPFVKLNCAAVPSELIESELFGYERGAFTGAFQKKPGLFEMADGGTILLDEIGDMDVRLQAKLLQVLQDQEFRRVGGIDVVRVNVRVIAATHRDLVQAIRDRTFREDLYYRLNIFTLALPPLRDRKEDMIDLAEFLMSRHSTPENPPIPITAALEGALLNFPWPGNIRQLENVVRKLMVLRDPEIIARELRSTEMTDRRKGGSLPSEEVIAMAAPTPFKPENILEEASRRKQETEAEVILQALHSSRWNRKQAAATLKLEYKTLLYKMKKLAIEERAAKTATWAQMEAPEVRG